jgi:DNA-binding GntR family transcriptional regulator
VREFFVWEWDKIPAMTSADKYTQLNQQVADKIRALIADGKITPGEWLRQEHLAREVGVSHTPFREAVKLLVAEGLLEHLPHRGVRLVQFSVQDIEDLYMVRGLLESRTAREAAKNITDAELSELESLLAEMRENLAPDQISHYRNLNRRFHQVIYTASRHQYLIRILNQVWAFSPTMLWAQFVSTASTPLSSRTDADPMEHGNILSALRRRDSHEAERLMREHIESARQDLMDAIPKRDDAAIPE